MLTKRPELTVVKVADGAKDNWTFLTALVPEGEERVDFFHAAEQLALRGQGVEVRAGPPTR